MGIIDWLRKLGILRSGVVKATYHSGKDRPTALMMHDVLDEDKDLTHKTENKPAATGKQ